MLPLVVRVEDVNSQQSAVFAFQSSPVHLGRSELNDLALPQPFVSLWHAIIRFDDKKVHYVDLGSTNGTTLDGQPLQKGVRTDVSVPRELRIGTLRLTFARDAGSAQEASVVRKPTLFSEHMSSNPALSAGTLALNAKHVSVLLQSVRSGAQASEVTGTPIQPAPPLIAAAAVTGGPGKPVVINRYPQPDASAKETTAVTQLHLGPLAFQDPGPEAAGSGPANSTLQDVAGADPVAFERTRMSPPRVAAKPSTAPGIQTDREVATPPRASTPRAPSAQVSTWVEGLVAPYLDFRRTWHALHAQLHLGLGDLPEAERSAALEALAARFPAMDQEEEFRELRATLSGQRPAPRAEPVSPVQPAVPQSALASLAEPARPATGAGAPSATSILSAFAASYAPVNQPLSTPAQAEMFLERLSQVLEAFASAYLALQKGKEQFEREMGVATGGGRGALQRAKNVGDVLRYLLDLGKSDAPRVEQLTRGFAEVMIQQVALLNGIREGARGLIGLFSREALAKPGPRGGPLDFLFPYRARWRRLEERQRMLLEEDSALTGALFGPEFARSYAAVASEEAAEPSSDASKGKR